MEPRTGDSEARVTDQAKLGNDVANLTAQVTWMRMGEWGEGGRGGEEKPRWGIRGGGGRRRTNPRADGANGRRRGGTDEDHSQGQEANQRAANGHQPRALPNLQRADDANNAIDVFGSPSI